MILQNIKLVIFGLFVLALSACSKDDNITPTNASDGSVAELSFNGTDYNIEGIGAYQIIDTTIVVDGKTYDFKALNCNIARQEQNKGFSFIIFGYDKIGVYPFWKYDVEEYSGLFFIGYADFLNNIGISSGPSFPNHEEGIITITKDNNSEIIGAISADAYANGNTNEVSKLTGKFTIKK